MHNWHLDNTSLAPLCNFLSLIFFWDSLNGAPPLEVEEQVGEVTDSFLNEICKFITGIDLQIFQ